MRVHFLMFTICVPNLGSEICWTIGIRFAIDEMQPSGTKLYEEWNRLEGSRGICEREAVSTMQFVICRPTEQTTEIGGDV